MKTIIVIVNVNKCLNSSIDKSQELKTSNAEVKLDPVGSTVRYEMMKLCTVGQYRIL